ncbi:hypothetical protein MN086_06440 [Sulfurovum sp. XGS-02]|uniref:hypothetical protein n=1 Tax=Sulfurovum sp. XGS-02 TaxID=2925411 RepID=UPI0020501DA1|nr:hypothetical protein [Sulfurovum sp. XGS-02]UPT76691.1 hypothetical protein MN086_06440 [Sulfurovum sp. XGS-02]
MAEKLLIDSASLLGFHNPQVIHELKKFNTYVNSYYSNDIHFEGAHPSLMDRYTKESLSTNSKESRLQLRSLKYIEQQKILEKYFNDCSVVRIPEKLPYEIHNKIFDSSNNVDTNNTHYFTWPNHITVVEKVINSLQLHYLITQIHYRSDEYRIVARLILDGLLSTIKGYGLWNISRGLHIHSTEYEKYLNIEDKESEAASWHLETLSVENSNRYIKFMLEVALEQVHYVKEHITTNKIYQNIQNYLHLSSKGSFYSESFSKDSELLFKELLLLGEIRRGDVASIINKKSRTSTYLIKKLTEMDLITSDTPKSPIRLKFNMHFTSHLFPELVR